MHARHYRFSVNALLIGSIVALVLPAAAADSLTPYSAQYKVRVSVVGGQLTTELRQIDDHFIATHVIRPTGVSRLLSRGEIAETSEFVESNDGIRPAEYHAVDTLSHDKERVDIRFDWDSGEARGAVNGDPVISVMKDVAHDRVSIQYELMDDLLNNRTRSEYVLFDIDRLKPVTVRNIGRKYVDVPAGRFNVVGIQHQTDNSKRVTTLWCAKELGYLPVVIEQHRKGELRVRAVLTDYKALDAITSEQ